MLAGLLIAHVLLFFGLRVIFKLSTEKSKGPNLTPVVSLIPSHEAKVGGKDPHG